MTRKILAVLSGWVLCLSLAYAVDIEGVRVEEQITVAGGPQLVLNGAGVRHKLVFVKLYIGALYLPAKSSNADEIINDAGPKRIAMFV